MRRSGSVLVALALIGTGVLLLLRDAGVVGERIRIWPLLVLLFGAAVLVDRAATGSLREGGLAGPLVLVAVGALFLLQDLGAVERDLSVWPILLIAAGVGIALSGLGLGRPPRRVAVEAVALDGATSGRLVLRHGAGRLSVGATHEPGAFLEGTFVGGVERRVERRGDRIEVRLSPPAGVWRTIAPWRRGGSLDWTVSLSRRVPLSLDLAAGAARAEIDLSDLRAGEIDLQAGASDVDLRLPASGRTACRVKAGAAKLRVRVPDRVAGRIVVRGGASSLRVDEVRFRRKDGSFESPDFEEAEHRAELDLDVGAADVEVR